MQNSDVIDFCAMVPAQVFNCLQDAEEKKKLESVRNLIIGGAPVNYTLLQQIRELPGNVYLHFRNDGDYVAYSAS
jgi:o-succinylbenzoate---CoA ligase